MSVNRREAIKLTTAVVGGAAAMTNAPTTSAEPGSGVVSVYDAYAESMRFFHEVMNNEALELKDRINAAYRLSDLAGQVMAVMKESGHDYGLLSSVAYHLD